MKAIPNPPVSVITFRSWVESCPDNEHWELIAGVPTLKAPATKGCRRIASNIDGLLRDAFEVHRPDLLVYQRIGLNLASIAPDYDPEPDIVVVDADVAGDECYSERFYLVAEVLDTNRKTVERKCDVYKRHPECRCVLIVDQKRLDVRLSVLERDGWTEHRLTKPEDQLVLDDFGLRCTLVDLYRGTALVLPARR